MSSLSGPVTQHELLSLSVWIDALAKALIKKGILTKDEVQIEMHIIMAKPIPEDLKAEIRNMIIEVDKW